MPESPAPETHTETNPVEVPKSKQNVRQLTPPEYNYDAEDRKETRNLRLTFAVAALTVIGTAYFSYKYTSTPEYQQQAATAEAQKQEDLKRSAQIAQETFEGAKEKETGSGLFIIDLSRLDEAVEILKKYHNSTDNNPSSQALGRENFHFFKDAHPQLEIIGIVDPSDIRASGYGEFVDKPNQMIVITRAKGK